MASFEVKVYKMEILPHPNADAIELARIGDYVSAVRKGEFVSGDLGVYIPEASVLPDWLIKRLGLEGRLAGSKKNRVKAIKLRKILSQGLIYPIISNNDANVLTFEVNGTEAVIAVKEGDDVAKQLGITKYEPPIPVHMAGEVYNAQGLTLKFDIENIKKYPRTFNPSEEVVMTEKLHGTWCCFGYHPLITDCHLITSKGLSDKGLALKINNRNKENLYIRALDSTANDHGENVIDRAHAIFGHDGAFYILGEVFGPGVQDLHYGCKEPAFRVFDIYLGNPSQGEYLNYDDMMMICNKLNVKTVPEVYRGPFFTLKVRNYTDGRETLSGGELNIREGIVIRPIKERRDDSIGRVILKSVSEKYLLRKGKKGKKITEYQ